jgi:NADH dehydrogenase [ubiquinone] 1 alpha subcomplex assembly factor 7
MPASPDLAGEIRRLIACEGPISIERYMGLANTHYYATHDAIGAAGDFITAPEISQMFGEMVGLALADAWQRAGAPDVALVELGPGRGTLAADMLRAMAVGGLRPPLHLVETSPLLRARQKERHGDAVWHDTIDTVPVDRPLLIVANEFFDALPVRQFVNTADGWRERLVDHGDEGFVATIGDRAPAGELPASLRELAAGTIIESCPEARRVAGALASRVTAQGGMMLLFDYGYDGPSRGDTLQAVREHAYADPFADPGGRDLTAHVDFAGLAGAAQEAGAALLGPVPQGQWLIALGLAQRAAALSRGAPVRSEEIAAAYRRLTAPEEMGELFKVMAITAPHWPEPAGFR